MNKRNSLDENMGSKWYNLTMKDNELNIHDAVDAIAEILLGDSRISIDKRAMTWALDRDLVSNGIRRLTEEEIEILCLGEDLDGSSELEKLYPHTISEISKYF